MLALKIIIIALAVILAACFAAAAILFRFACGRPKKAPDIGGGIYATFKDQLLAGKVWFESRNPEQVTIHAHDGIKLAARTVEVPDARAVVILVHGFHGSGMSDMGCVLEYYGSLGFNIVLIDQRATGMSEGKYVTFGARESRDVADWARYAAKRWGDLPILLDGISLGAATVLMATAHGLPESVKGIIADCGYTTPRAIMAHVLKRNYHLPKFPIMNIAELLTKHIARFSIDTSATEAMAKCNIPVFFAHGLDDDFVPYRMTEENYAACASEKHLLLVEGAAHGTSWHVANERYKREINAFFDKYLFGITAE